MPVYEYRCAGCGIIERTHSITDVPATERCTVCGGDAARVISAPMLRRVPAKTGRLFGQAEKSRDEPDVVTREPAPERAPARSVNPKLEKLVGKESAGELRTVPHPARHTHH